MLVLGIHLGLGWAGPLADRHDLLSLPAAPMPNPTGCTPMPVQPAYTAYAQMRDGGHALSQQRRAEMTDMAQCMGLAQFDNWTKRVILPRGGYSGVHAGLPYLERTKPLGWALPLTSQRVSFDRGTQSISYRRGHDTRSMLSMLRCSKLYAARSPLLTARYSLRSQLAVRSSELTPYPLHRCM